MTRAVFRGELEQLGIELTTMSRMASDAMERAVHALLRSDLFLAEQVIGGDAVLDRARAHCEEHAVGLLSLHAPVARDLRLVVTSIRVAEKIERMGDLARHVAELARRRHPAFAVPDELAARFAEMGRLAVCAARAVEQAIAESGTEHFAAQDYADDRVDELQREILAAARRPGGPCAVRDGVDVALLARFMERFADQAVSIIRRLDYIVTVRHPADPPSEAAGAACCLERPAHEAHGVS